MLSDVPGKSFHEVEEGEKLKILFIHDVRISFNDKKAFATLGGSLL